MRWFFLIMLTGIIIVSVFWWQEKDLPESPDSDEPTELPQPLSMKSGDIDKNLTIETKEFGVDRFPENQDWQLAPIVEKKTLDLLTKIIAQVDKELTTGKYGEPDSLSYIMVFLFKESLRDYKNFLEKPSEGPLFHILQDSDFSGRYNFNTEQILLGSFVLEHGQARFLATFFHEYQHYIFHSIYGTPDKIDIVHKFYNEITGYLYEFLLLDYLPPNLFLAEGNYRGDDPKIIRQLLQENRPYEVIYMLFDWILPPGEDPLPVYNFLMPVAKDKIERDDLVYSIDAEFHPDPDVAENLQEISAEFFGIDEEGESIEEESEEEILEEEELGEE